MIYSYPNTNFNIHQIANSGQCFRWKWVDAGTNQYYKVPICDFDAKVMNEANEVLVSTEAPEYLVRRYFDMDTDYSQIISEIPEEDEFLKEAAQMFSGLRILIQPQFETIVSFIISQNNNIPKIKKSIEALCDQTDGSFPGPADMDRVNLSKCGLGYRQKYIEDLIHHHYFVPDEDSSYKQAMQFYQNFKGIGPKVANCICLYGLHYLEACPIDVWMKKIIDKRYGDKDPDWMHSKWAGVYQQYCFCYERYLSGRDK